MKKYTDKDMLKIISGIEAEFEAHLAKTEEEMKKSEAVEPENFDYDEEDLAELDKVYASMSKKEAETHYRSLKKSLFKEEESEEKKEEKKEEVKEEAVEKSETIEITEVSSAQNEEFDKIKSENAELKKSIEQFSKVIELLKNKVVSAPKQKAITNLDFIKKSEEVENEVSTLSNSEINKRLNNKIREGKLNKSDKEAITNFFNEPNSSVESIKHLL